MAEQSRWRLAFYQDERGRRPVEEWLLALGIKERARAHRTFNLLEIFGPELTMPYARHLEGKLWELRIASGRLDYRVVYAGMSERRFVLLHAFDKRTTKTPALELETARRRWRDYSRRQGGEEK